MEVVKRQHDHYGFYAVCPNCGEAEQLTSDAFLLTESNRQAEIVCNICGTKYLVERRK